MSLLFGMSGSSVKMAKGFFLSLPPFFFFYVKCCTVILLPQMQSFEPNVFVGPSFLCVRASGEQPTTKQGKNMLILCSQALWVVGAQLTCYPIGNPDHVVASFF